MKEIINRIDEELGNFEPISLAQMSDIRLMNRVDTKYLINIDQLPGLLKNISVDYYAQEIDGLRKAFYHTVYYDTRDGNMFLMHQNNKLDRQKIRLREYVESDLRFLEIKKKDNKGRTKKIRIPVDSENILDKIESIRFINEKSLYNSEELVPRLKNDFYRITLVTKEKTERLTIDMNINFWNFRTANSESLPGLCIVEVKQDENTYSPIKDYLFNLRVKRKSISKYCLGMVLTDSELKANQFKRKLIYINKLLKNEVIGNF